MEENVMQNESLRTYILMWNPAISSYKMKHFERDFKKLMYGELDDFNWSVWDWQHAREGDRCFLVKVGEGTTGIVMSGVFCTNPYIDKDWSSRDRVVHYMDIEVEYMFHPERGSILSSDVLKGELPDFDWSRGHSGVELSADTAAKLEKLWGKHIEANRQAFEPAATQLTDVWALIEKLNEIE